jgi:hypothetical protein
MDFCESALSRQAIVVVLIVPPSFWAGGYSTDPQEMLEALCCGAEAAALAEAAVQPGGHQLRSFVDHVRKCSNEAPGAGSVRLCPIILCNGREVRYVYEYVCIYIHICIVHKSHVSIIVVYMHKP